MLGAALALVLAGAPAMAADMPVKATPVPMPAVSTWTGFYLGADIEAMLSEHWIARADYRFSDYGTTSINETVALGAFSQTYTYNLRIFTHAAEFGLRYKF